MRELEVELIESRELTLPQARILGTASTGGISCERANRHLRRRRCSEPGLSCGTGCVESSHPDCGETDARRYCIGTGNRTKRAWILSLIDPKVPKAYP